MQKNIIILILLLMLAGGLSYYLRHSVIIRNDRQSIITPVTESISSSTMKVKVALLGIPKENSNQENFVGCDVVEFQEREVQYSTSPLTSAIKELFSEKDTWQPSELTPGNFISSQQELFFDRVIIENAVAKIYLLGKIGPLNGVCDNPRLRIQLEETALVFPTVQSVEFYLNGTKNDLVFSEKGI